MIFAAIEVTPNEVISYEGAGTTMTIKVTGKDSNAAVNVSITAEKGNLVPSTNITRVFFSPLST